MPDTRKLSVYRWVIELLLLLLLTVQTIEWLAPAPILKPIITALEISRSDAGLIISIIALCIAIFSFVGAFVAERLGALRALLLGIWMLALGGILSGYAGSLGTLLACRVIQGIGFGVVISPPGTLIMQWFGEKEWPYINMINFLCSYVGMTFVFRATAPLYLRLGSDWNAVLWWYGIACAGVALLWTILGRERAARPVAAVTSTESTGSSTLFEVMKMRDVQLIAAGLFGGMWVFQLYTAFLPLYFATYRGFDLTQASSLTAALPLTGIFAAAAGGFGTALSGLRKPFTWPVALVTLFGCIGAISASTPSWISFSLVLVGIGSAGSLAAITTMLMELPGMTPIKMGSGLAFVWAVGYTGAFVAPFLGGAVADMVGLRAVMLGFLALQLLPVIAMYPLPETGPRGARVEIAAAS